MEAAAEWGVLVTGATQVLREAGFFSGPKFAKLDEQLPALGVAPDSELTLTGVKNAGQHE